MFQLQLSGYEQSNRPQSLFFIKVHSAAIVKGVKNYQIPLAEEPCSDQLKQ